MEIDSTTLILELINFAILVWVLHKLLFRPIRSILEQRGAKLQQIADQARTELEKAEQLRAQHNLQLKDWNDEVSKLRGALQSELAQLKTQGLEDLHAAIQKEEERLTAAHNRTRQEALKEVEKLGISQGARFIRKFLERLSGVELDVKLLQLLFEDLENLPTATKEQLSEIKSEYPTQIIVKTAHPLPESEQEFVSERCRTVLRADGTPNFVVDQSLISGARLSFGAWELRADIQGELGFFFQGLDNQLID
jgi:F-type H+-transporting ATPase subunit b